MGTNYFLRTGICKCCGRYDETHICKSFSTWHAPTKRDPDALEDVVLIATVEGWKNHVRTEVEGGARIFDEYNIEHPLWWFMEQADLAPVHDDNIRDPRWWLDADGHRFYAGEFS